MKQFVLFVASGAASLALAVGLAWAGFGSRPAALAPAGTISPAMAADLAPETVTVVDPVYIPAAAPQKTVTVHRSVNASAGGESENEHESESGDD